MWACSFERTDYGNSKTIHLWNGFIAHWIDVVWCCSPDHRISNVTVGSSSYCCIADWIMPFYCPVVVFILAVNPVSQICSGSRYGEKANELGLVLMAVYEG